MRSSNPSSALLCGPGKSGLWGPSSPDSHPRCTVVTQSLRQWVGNARGPCAHPILLLPPTLPTIKLPLILTRTIISRVLLLVTAKLPSLTSVDLAQASRGSTQHIFRACCQHLRLGAQVQGWGCTQTFALRRVQSAQCSRPPLTARQRSPVRVLSIWSQRARSEKRRASPDHQESPASF